MAECTKTPNYDKGKKGGFLLSALTGLVMLICLSGCADSVSFSVAASVEPVGFWYGLWHGTILPFSWLVSLFSDSTAIYAIYNNGGWYDFGFAIGVGALGRIISCGFAEVTHNSRLDRKTGETHVRDQATL